MFFDIIIIFIVIGIVGNILKNIGRQNQWERSNVPERPIVQEKPNTPVMQRNVGQKYRPQRIHSIPTQYNTGIDDDGSSTLEGISLEAQTPYGGLYIESPETEVLQRAAGQQSGFSLDRNSIINGIIMSEILQPPRCIKIFGKSTKER